jgi:hypothetical protein
VFIGPAVSIGLYTVGRAAGSETNHD